MERQRLMDQQTEAYGPAKSDKKEAMVNELGN